MEDQLIRINGYSDDGRDIRTSSDAVAKVFREIVASAYGIKPAKLEDEDYKSYFHGLYRDRGDPRWKMSKAGYELNQFKTLFMELKKSAETALLKSKQKLEYFKNRLENDQALQKEHLSKLTAAQSELKGLRQTTGISLREMHEWQEDIATEIKSLKETVDVDKEQVALDSSYIDIDSEEIQSEKAAIDLYNSGIAAIGRKDRNFDCGCAVDDIIKKYELAQDLENEGQN